MPLKATETGRLYQPLTSAARAGSPRVAVGAVASYLSVNAWLEEFPAWSRHEPVTDAVAESGPPYVTAGHSATPDVASVPRIAKATERLNQPPAFAARSG